MIASDAETTTDNLKFLPTCTDSLIMVFPLIDAGGAAKRVEWRLWPTSRSPASLRSWGRLFRPTTKGREPLAGIAFRGLAAAAGSQFLTAVLNEGTAHSGAAGVRVFEPGERLAIQRGSEHARCVFAMSN